MNHLTIIGNLTRDPELRTTPNGKVVCNFSVAVNRRGAQGQNEADFFQVSAWGALGENCQRYLAKGRKVAVVGQISLSQHTGQDGKQYANIAVFATSVEFLSPKTEGAGSGHGGGYSGDAPEGMSSRIEDDDLPF